MTQPLAHNFMAHTGAGRRRTRAALRDVTVLELLGSDEIAKETPVQRYRRLQAELSQLTNELASKRPVHNRPSKESRWSAH